MTAVLALPSPEGGAGTLSIAGSGDQEEGSMGKNSKGNGAGAAKPDAAKPAAAAAETAAAKPGSPVGKPVGTPGYVPPGSAASRFVPAQAAAGAYVAHAKVGVTTHQNKYELRQERLVAPTVASRVEGQRLHKFALVFDRVPWQQLWAWVDLAAPKEVSGFGVVHVDTKDSALLRVTELCLPKQVSSAGDTTIEGAACSAEQYRLIQEGRDNDAERMLLWWHSHGSMKPFWSGQDESAIRAIEGDPYLISLVVNSDREYECRLDIWKPIRATFDTFVGMDLGLRPDEDEKVRSTFADRYTRAHEAVTSVGYTHGRYVHGRYAHTPDADMMGFEGYEDYYPGAGGAGVSYVAKGAAPAAGTKPKTAAAEVKPETIPAQSGVVVPRYGKGEDEFAGGSCESFILAPEGLKAAVAVGWYADKYGMPRVKAAILHLSVEEMRRGVVEEDEVLSLAFALREDGDLSQLTPRTQAIYLGSEKIVRRALSIEEGAKATGAAQVVTSP